MVRLCCNYHLGYRLLIRILCYNNSISSLHYNNSISQYTCIGLNLRLQTHELHTELALALTRFEE